MKKYIRYLNYPKGFIPNAAPWYIILGRMPFYAFYILGILIAFTGVLGAFGYTSAMQFLRSNS